MRSVEIAQWLKAPVALFTKDLSSIPRKHSAAYNNAFFYLASSDTRHTYSEQIPNMQAKHS